MVDDSVWSVIDNNKIQVNLEKQDPSTYWKCAIRYDEEVATEDIRDYRGMFRGVNHQIKHIDRERPVMDVQGDGNM